MHAVDGAEEAQQRRNMTRSVDQALRASLLQPTGRRRRSARPLDEVIRPPASGSAIGGFYAQMLMNMGTTSHLVGEVEEALWTLCKMSLRRGLSFVPQEDHKPSSMHESVRGYGHELDL